MRTSPKDQPVVEYLAALEARRAATETLPHPDEAADNLARADMVEPDEEGETVTLREELGAGTPGSDANVERLEPAFVEHAREFSLRHGMTYQSWREAGVEAEVLDRAGIQPD